MRHCSKARRWFGAFWDDEITQAEREWLEAHFAGCDDCRAEYERFAHTLESVAALPRHEAAPDFVEQVLARARRATPMADAIERPRPIWVPLAAAASLLLVVASLLAPWANREGSSTATRNASLREAELVVHQQPLGAGQASRAPAAAALSPNAAPSQEQVAALVDSLIDHSADVDFVLDPVRVSRERTAGRLVGPAHGQRAVITF